MRRNFVVFLLVPLVIVLIVVYLFIDQWVESGIEAAGESIVGARVEVDELELSLFPVGLEWKRMQVANPKDTWKNIFETGLVRFRMDAGQLLRAKFIIETMEMNDLFVGTKRTTDGALPPEPEPEPDQRRESEESTIAALTAPIVAETKKDVPSFDLDRIRKDLKVDSLLNARNLESFVLIDSLTRELRAAGKEWDTTLAGIDAAQARIAQIEQNVRSIDVNAIKSVQQAQEAFDNAKRAYEGSQQVVGTFQERKRVLTASVGRFSGGLGSIDDAARRDFQRVIDMAKLPDVSMAGLAELVLGREILTQAHGYLGYIDMARDLVPKGSSSDEVATPARFRGRVVHFPTDRAYPKLWIKQILITGGGADVTSSENFRASGRVTDISTDQRTTGKPLVVDLDAKRASVTTSFDATFDRREEMPRDQYRVNASGIPIASFPLGSQDFLPAHITNAHAQADVRVDVPGSGLEAASRISFGEMRIVYDRDARNQVERLTRDVLSSIHSLFVNLRLWKDTTGALGVAFTTDLDDQLASRARAVIGAEVTRLRNELRAKVDAKISEKKRAIRSLYDQKRTQIQTRITDAENQIKQKLLIVEQKKKELEDRVAAEKKKLEDAAKKKAGDVLKGILRKN